MTSLIQFQSLLIILRHNLAEEGIKATDIDQMRDPLLNAAVNLKELNNSGLKANVPSKSNSLGESSQTYWNDLLDIHFAQSSQGASLLVLQSLQLMANNSSNTVISEEGLLQWK